MTWSRREFLRTCLTGALVVPLAGRSIASDLLLPEDPVSAELDSALLDDLERVSFDYFWNESDPNTGLIRDRALADGGDTRLMGSIAATGFGLTALCIGHQRQYRNPKEIAARVRNTLRFLLTDAHQVNGFFYHFVDIHTGNRYGVSEISPIDMAILLCGVLTCREYFHDSQIRHDATELYRRVDWNWMLNDGDAFALEWTPEFGFSHLRWTEYSESMMLYLLALGSPRHPIPAECWNKIQRPWLVYDNYRYISSPAPLFIHQFSHAWFDFRGKKDSHADYFANSVLACQAHREFCRKLNSKFPCYSGEVWGITSSDSSAGYVAWGGPPILGPIDGTIVPAAAAGSLPFISAEAVSVLRNLRGYYGRQIWKKYGFVDAFNPLTGWASSDVVGIDVGISMLMAENARSRFVWDTFMRNHDVQVAMERAGFHDLPTPPSVYAYEPRPKSLIAKMEAI
jgi:hypothetical protein